MTKKFGLSVLATGLLLGAAIASQAQSVTYTLLDDKPWTTVGVSGDAATDTALISNILFDPVPNPITYATPSVVKFGDDFTTPGLGAPNTSTTFTATPVDFHFTLDDGTTTDLFHVTGQIDGTVGYGATGNPFSQAKITFTGLDQVADATDAVVLKSAVASIDPNNGLAALLITTALDGSAVNLWIDTPQSKPAPGSTLSVAGFINAVPEGGTWTLLASTGITGGVFMLRRKRRA
jgi:hypothetical protein